MTGEQVKRVTVEKARRALRIRLERLPDYSWSAGVSSSEHLIAAFEAAVREDERERALAEFNADTGLIYQRGLGDGRGIRSNDIRLSDGSQP